MIKGLLYTVLRISITISNKSISIFFVTLSMIILILVNYWYYNSIKKIEIDYLQDRIKLYHEVITSGFIKNLKKVISQYPMDSFNQNLIFNVEPLLTKKLYKEEIKITPYLIKIAKKRNSDYIQNHSASSSLNISFIKKATDIYLKASEKNQYNRLFPLMLVDDNAEKFNLRDLKDDIKKYFLLFSKSVSLNINLEKDIIHYSLGKESLYQIVFSIVKTIILIVRDQSEKHQELNINFNDEDIIFEFSSFPLSIEKIGKLSVILSENQPDVFLLDFNTILLSLSKHNLKYSMSNVKKWNIFRIMFTQNQKEQNIIKFDRNIKCKR